VTSWGNDKIQTGAVGKTRGWWSLREWTKRHGQKRGCGKCSSTYIGTMWQGWTLQELTYRHGMARIDNAREKTCPSKLNVQVENVTILDSAVLWRVIATADLTITLLLATLSIWAVIGPTVVDSLKLQKNTVHPKGAAMVPSLATRPWFRRYCSILWRCLIGRLCHILVCAVVIVITVSPKMVIQRCGVAAHVVCDAWRPRTASVYTRHCRSD